MDSVQETPVKKRRTENGYVSTQTQSQDLPEDGSDLSVPQDVYETVATLPLDQAPPRTPPQAIEGDYDNDTLVTIPFGVTETPFRQNWSQLPPSSYATQPTQIINQVPRSSSPDPAPAVVQVAASSPAQPSSRPQARPGEGALASRMAPPGTQFRLPPGARPSAGPTQSPVKKAQPIIIDSDDEGPLYVRDSDEDDSYNRDLKPTIIKDRKRPSQSGSTQSSFSASFLEQFRHNSGDKNGSAHSSFSSKPAASMTGDAMANAYGGVSRPVRPLQRQRGPAKAMAVVPELNLDDIEDHTLRRRVETIRSILPSCTIAQCYMALVKKKGNESDAMDYLASLEDEAKEASGGKSNGQNGGDVDSDDELSGSGHTQGAGKIKKKPDPQSTSQSRQKNVKQRAPPRETIQQRYMKDSGHRSSQLQPSPQKASLEDQKASAKRGKLQRGRKFQSPAKSQNVISLDTSSPPGAPVSIESDSEISVDPEPSPEASANLLDFLNSCTVDELIDLSQATKERAELVLANRPFAKLTQLRDITQEAAPKAGAKRKGRALAIGDKILDDCESNWRGFQAVDELVERCESIGKPIAEAMKKWGVDIYGSANNGELEIVNVDELASGASVGKDSGLGSSRANSSALSGDEGDALRTPKTKRGPAFFPQPSILREGVVLKDYQIVGINWLTLLFKHGMSCILADDMGLGKTCQVISFLAHLKETGIGGQHLIIVPSSVLENWLREFQNFCPDIKVMPYSDKKDAREQLRYAIMEEEPEVIIATYTIAKNRDDRKFFSSLGLTSCVFDEGHQLKNPESKQYKELMRIGCDFRLLLTGTPLQNNLGELIALLAFMMPDMFREHHEDLKSIFGLKATTTDATDQDSRLLSARRVQRAKTMITPYILRRKKHQVMKSLPAKTQRIEYCDMSDFQAEQYHGIVANYKDLMRRRAEGQRISPKEQSNVMMDLRKAAIHPMLFRRRFNDQQLRKISRICVEEGDFPDSNPELVYEDLYYASDMEMQRWCGRYSSVQRFQLEGEPWMDSGKVSALLAMLQNFQANGDRALVFSQFVIVLDVLEEVLQTAGLPFSRLDGGTDINERQPLIDAFTADTSVPVFLLSTKAGGAGINLAAANKVIIFDSSFNPQDDVQAENRAHRVGQTREVEVVRLVTRGTVEEQILALGQTKLALDERVAAETAGTGGDDAAAAKKVEAAGAKEVQRLLAEQLEDTGDDA